MAFQRLTAHGLEGEIWMALFRALPTHLQDIHWLPAYARAQEREGERAVLHVFRDGERFIMQAFMVRAIEGGWSDRTSLYSFGGPVGKGATPWLIETFHEYLSVAFGPDYPVACEFSTLHPLHVDHQTGLLRAERAPHDIAVIKDVVVMDLSPMREEMLAACARHTRRSIAKALERGVWVVRERPDRDNVEMFIDLYVKSLERLSAGARWMKTLDHIEGYFHDRDLEGHVHIFTANFVGVHRALLVLHWGGAAYAQFLGSNGENFAWGMDDLLYFEAAVKLKEYGCHRFVLGGGLTADPSDRLLAFKAGFSDNRAPLRSYFRIGNPAAYESLAKAQREIELVAHGRESTSSFLPIYRRDFQ